MSEVFSVLIETYQHYSFQSKDYSLYKQSCLSFNKEGEKVCHNKAHPDVDVFLNTMRHLKTRVLHRSELFHRFIYL